MHQSPPRIAADLLQFPSVLAQTRHHRAPHLLGRRDPGHAAQSVANILKDGCHLVEQRRQVAHSSFEESGEEHRERGGDTDDRQAEQRDHRNLGVAV